MRADDLQLARWRVVDADNHYRTLGIAPKADPDEIKAAHRKLASLFHPDRRNGLTPAESQMTMAKINVAYTCLSDPEARRVYDLVAGIDKSLCAKCGGLGYTVKQAGFTKRVRRECPACKGVA